MISCCVSASSIAISILACFRAEALPTSADKATLRKAGCAMGSYYVESSAFEGRWICSQEHNTFDKPVQHTI